MNIEQILKDILIYAECWQLVGSRVTCSPAPDNTDQDVLVLVDGDEPMKFIDAMKENGFDVELGEGYAEDALNDGRHDSFQSYRLGDINLIATIDEGFYRKFVVATSVAKHLNLLKKEDRIALFQAVLYGNPCDDSLPKPWPPKQPGEYEWSDDDIDKMFS